MTADTNMTTVMLVDDHSVVRAGLQELLASTGEFDVVGQAADGVEAVRLAQTINPDIIVMDVIMPEKDGIEACREIRDILPNTRVLMLTASDEEDAVINSVAAGATGYLQKYTDAASFLAAVREVASGEFRIPAEAAHRVFHELRRVTRNVDHEGLAKLDARDRKILALFAVGNTHAEIGNTLGNSHLTVRNILYKIHDKLGIKTKQELVVWTVQNGLLDDNGILDSARQDTVT